MPRANELERCLRSWSRSTGPGLTSKWRSIVGNTENSFSTSARSGAPPKHTSLNCTHTGGIAGETYDQWVIAAVKHVSCHAESASLCIVSS